MRYADFIAELERLIVDGRAILQRGATHKDPAFRKWRHEAESIVETARTRGFDVPGEFNSSRRQYLALWMGASTQDNVEALGADLNDSIVELEFIVGHYRKYGESTADAAGDEVTALDPSISVERICGRIPLVIRQLRDRHDGRQTLKIDDEYDLQDLLHGLLHLFFDDVRPEEHTPSYAGKATRMDFLLKNESIVIEAKMTRRGLEAKEVGEQLIIDIAHYKAHPDCASLFCLVYDPDHRVDNPRGLENDLSKKTDGMAVRVFVVPR
jgi:hypothetical protein